MRGQGKEHAHETVACVKSDLNNNNNNKQLVEEQMRTIGGLRVGACAYLRNGVDAEVCGFVELCQHLGHIPGMT